MAINFVGGDRNVVNVEQITAGANLCGKSLVTAAGAVPASAAGLSYGVVSVDTPSGQIAEVKNGAGSLLEVIATGTVTKGGLVEVLTASVYANISGTSTSVTAAGVQDIASGFPVGIAHTGSDAGGTVLIEFIPAKVKGAVS